MPRDGVVADRQVSLTAAERGVIRLICEHALPQEISERLARPLDEVRAITASACRKIGVGDRIALALWGREHGFGDPLTLEPLPVEPREAGGGVNYSRRNNRPIHWTPGMLAALEPLVEGRVGMDLCAEHIGISPLGLVSGLIALVRRDRAAGGAA